MPGAAPGGHVVGGVAVGKAIGHDEVDDVVAGDTLKSALLRLPRKQRQSSRWRFPTEAWIAIFTVARLRGFRDVQPDEGMLSVGLSFDFLHPHAGIVDGDVRRLQGRRRRAGPSRGET